MIVKTVSQSIILNEQEKIYVLKTRFLGSPEQLIYRKFNTTLLINFKINFYFIVVCNSLYV